MSIVNQIFCRKNPARENADAGFKKKNSPAKSQTCQMSKKMQPASAGVKLRSPKKSAGAKIVRRWESVKT